MSNVALIGAGPVGSLIAASLLSNGVPFKWVVRNPFRRAELASELTLRISGQPDLNLPTDPEVLYEQPSEAMGAEWILLAVKAQHVLPVLAELNPYPGSKVLVVTNGLHDGPFHLGLLYGGAYLDNGVLVTGDSNRLVTGPLGDITDWSGELLSLLPQRWLSVENVLDIEPWMWRKVALNCVVNPLTALLDCENGRLMDIAGSPLVNSVLDEAAQVVYRESGTQLVLDPGELRAELISLLQATAGNSSSMREDIRAGRETEIELLNVEVSRRGMIQGVACPLNSALSQMVLALANRPHL